MESEALERLGLTTSASSSMTASSSAGENLDMALHNQLLSRSADAHISMKQYQNAVTYLEQARDIQDVLEDDIKGKTERKSSPEVGERDGGGQGQVDISGPHSEFI